MHVIPVIDVKGGVAVAARGGNRADYRPVETPLAKGSDPLAIARGFLALHPFDTLYVADLDGIAGGECDTASIEDLRAAFPGLQLMVDDGSAT